MKNLNIKIASQIEKSLKVKQELLYQIDKIEANENKGDIFLAISTSGNSINIIKALKKVKEKGLITICLTDKSGEKIKSLCDYCLYVPSNNMPRIQESHILIEHILCNLNRNSYI